MEMIAGRIEDTAVRDIFWQRPDNQKVRQRLAE